MIVVNIIMVLMMSSVRDSPAVERNTEWGMVDMSKNIIQEFILRETSMSTIMTNNKQTPAVKSSQIPPDKFTNDTKSKEKVTIGVKKVNNKPISSHIE